MLTRLTYEPPNAEAPISVLGRGLVPETSFYVRSNFPVPRLDPAAWHLDVDGQIGRPGRVTLAELSALPRAEQTVVLECAGNGRTMMSPVPDGTPWGLGAVGVARFGGIRLAALLEARGGLRSSAIELVGTGADHGTVEPDGEIPYQFNLPLRELAAADPILAWEMNGRPLSAEHGAPVRLIVPGHYGMRSVKWLTRIDVLDRPFEGHFARKYRYRGQAGVADETPVGEMRVRALITEPSDGSELDRGAVTLRGIAWSGGGPISTVELDMDGVTVRATFGEPLNGTGPVAWHVTWERPPAGRHVVAVRATDDAGNRQPLEPIWNAGGYGNNVAQRITLTVG
ncbi:MAG: sulfite oxidase [Candidatus Limnocylindria bacterium]